MVATTAQTMCILSRQGIAPVPWAKPATLTDTAQIMGVTVELMAPPRNGDFVWLGTPQTLLALRAAEHHGPLLL
jgi:hypothetical protein